MSSYDSCGITKRTGYNLSITPVPVEDVPVACFMRGNKRRHTCTVVETVLQKPKEVAT